MSAPPCFETPLSCLDVQELRMESLRAADLVEVGRLTDQRRPVCEADNLWRSNNITRGLWRVDNPDWAEDDDRWDEATEVEITFLTELSQFRRSNEAA
jgi:hypothetical protein